MTTSSLHLRPFSGSTVVRGVRPVTWVPAGSSHCGHIAGYDPEVINGCHMEEWEWGWEGAPSGGPERVGCGWLTSPPPRDSRYLVKGPRCLGSPHCQWSAPSARPAALPTLGCQVSDWPKHSTPLLRSRPECVLSPGSASKPPPRPGPPNTRFLGQHREVQTRGSRAAPLPNNPGPPP